MLEMPKAHTPQRSTLTGANVTVTKVEKRYEMVQGQILNTNNGKSAGKPEREPSTTRLAKSRRTQAIGVRSGVPL